MDFRDIEAEVDHQIAEEKRLRDEYRAERLSFKQRLLGSEDAYDWQVPSRIEDFDALLSQHAAQLSNAARVTMEHALSADIKVEAQAMAVGALTRLIQTNIAIAKVLGSGIAKSKTVHGVATPKEPQD